MKKPVPLPPIACWIFSPASSYVAMYAPHTRTTEGLACIAMRCCGLGCANADVTSASNHTHARRVVRAPIEAASYRILGAVGFGIDRRARSKKGRGLFRKA